MDCQKTESEEEYCLELVGLEAPIKTIRKMCQFFCANFILAQKNWHKMKLIFPMGSRKAINWEIAKAKLAHIDPFIDNMDQW